MSQGIVGKIWNIKAGSRGRSSAAKIGDSIEYISNSEKCNLALSQGAPIQMENELKYVMNDIKTLQGLYIGSRHITDVNNATNEMMQVKDFYGKLGGRIALHGIISLAQEESDSKNAGKLMYLLNDLMQEIFPEHQVVYAVHANTENLHIHFIANTVGLDGRKIHMDKQFMRKQFEPVLNKLAVKYGFTPNEAWVQEPKKDVVPIVERKMQLRNHIDRAIEESEDMEEVIKNLREKGITVNVGKFLSLRFPDMTRAMRSYQLGSSYTLETIVNRIITKRDPFVSKHVKVTAADTPGREMVWYAPTKMKKYKDMTVAEKKEAIRALRMGKNPWRDAYEKNWKLQKISSDLDRDAHVYDIIKSYSKGTNDVKMAKEEIKIQQKAIAAEKAEVKANLRGYKAIVDLYEEIKKYEIRAYLYEYGECLEYQEDYEKFKELTTRLEENFGKSINQVAEFIEDQEGELLYAKVQAEELAGQYRAILRYEKNILGRVEGENSEISLFQAVGHSEARNRVREYGAVSTRLAYVVAKGIEDIKIRVLTTPEIEDGKPSVSTTVTVMTKDGKVLEEYSSMDMTAKEFNQKINDTKYAYEFKYCHAFEDMKVADSFMEEQGAEKTKGKRKSK